MIVFLVCKYTCFIIKGQIFLIFPLYCLHFFVPLSPKNGNAPVFVITF